MQFFTTSTQIDGFLENSFSCTTEKRSLYNIVTAALSVFEILEIYKFKKNRQTGAPAIN